MRTGAIALAVTLAIQIFTAFAATSASVLAPVIGRDLAIAPKLVGVFVGIVYAGSMAASLASGMFIERHGAIRVSQVCVLLCAAGVLMVSGGTVLPGTAVLALAVAPLIIGLGYGPITPASSHVLARTAPPSRMALTFSIKQTGVPAGAALAGAALPILALQIGWRPTFALVAALGIVIALAAQIVRARLDTGRIPAQMPTAARVVAPLRHVLRTPALAELVVVAFVYAALQVCLTSFLVVYLTESLGYSLVAAGLRADGGQSRRDHRADPVGRGRRFPRCAAHASRADRRGRRSLRLGDRGIRHRLADRGDTRDLRSFSA